LAKSQSFIGNVLERIHDKRKYQGLSFTDDSRV